MTPLTTLRSSLAAPDGAELYAGGSTGLAVLAGRIGESRGWRCLLERAEHLGFSGALCRDPADAEHVRSLGVERVCLVAADDDASDALRLADAGACDALVLVSPRFPSDSATRALARSIRVPRLVLAGSTPVDVAQARRFDGMSAGHIALRFLPAPDVGHRLLEGKSGALAVESVWLFAGRVLGLERPTDHQPPTNHQPPQGTRKEKHG